MLFQVKSYRFRKRHILYVIFIVGLFFYLRSNVRFSRYVLTPELDTLSQDSGQFLYDLPLDKASPWPKFRCNALQNGRTEQIPVITDLKPWRIETGKGIFSSPVVDGRGTVYIGSGDHYFYAINQAGTILWKYKTGDVMDSSGLLDDEGNVYVGSGDGYVYAFNRESGKLLWKFKAHTPLEVEKEVGIKTYNVNWFEGNIGMLPNGNLLAPNDNYLIYEIDRKSGKRIKQFVANEMVWSLPAINTATKRMFFGSNFVALKNTFCFNLNNGQKEWSNGGYGTNAASILLSSKNKKGAAILGGYDGYIRAYAQEDGFQIWKFATRDHIYSSPAQLSDGTIIQASVDGTIYALDPETGKPKWTYDSNLSFRSSPAIDGHDNIYIGSGDGKLLALNSDGTFRWAYQCIDEERNDLNASPAVGPKGIYIAGESGGIFFVPFDYPLTIEGKKDPRSILADTKLNDGIHLVLANPFGNLQYILPSAIDANQSLTFILIVKENGKSLNAVIDRESLNCTFSGNQKARVDVSAEGRFLTIIPLETWNTSPDNRLTIKVEGKYRTGMKRIGLKHFWGKTSGRFEKEFVFKILDDHPSWKFPYRIPQHIGNPSTIFEYGRISAPYPTILPSYNQIGFESLRYHLGIVEGESNMAVLWGIQARQSGDSSVANPEMDDRFPLILHFKNGLLNLTNDQGFLLDFNGTWQMPYVYYRLATTCDSSGNIMKSPSVNAIVNCDDIEFYGYFLKINGMSDFKTGLMNISAGSDLKVIHENSKIPVELKQVDFQMSDKELIATLKDNKYKKSEFLFSILLIDNETGIPYKVDYSNKTHLETGPDGVVRKIILLLNEKPVKKLRAYILLNTYPVYKTIIN